MACISFCSALATRATSRLRLTQEDPPVVSVSWNRPDNTFGGVEGYRVSYGIKGENSEERALTEDTYRFTTSFLGKKSLSENDIMTKISYKQSWIEIYLLFDMLMLDDEEKLVCEVGFLNDRFYFCLFQREAMSTSFVLRQRML